MSLCHYFAFGNKFRSAVLSPDVGEGPQRVTGLAFYFPHLAPSLRICQTKIFENMFVNLFKMFYSNITHILVFERSVNIAMQRLKCNNLLVM